MYVIVNKQYMRVFVIALSAMSGLCSAETLKLRPDGPDATRMGMQKGYPVCQQALVQPE